MILTVPVQWLWWFIFSDMAQSPTQQIFGGIGDCMWRVQLAEEQAGKFGAAATWNESRCRRDGFNGNNDYHGAQWRRFHAPCNYNGHLDYIKMNFCAAAAAVEMGSPGSSCAWSLQERYGKGSQGSNSLASISSCYFWLADGTRFLRPKIQYESNFGSKEISNIILFLSLPFAISHKKVGRYLQLM